MSRNDPSHDDREGYAIAKHADSDMLESVLKHLIWRHEKYGDDTILILAREAFERGMGDMDVECWGMFDHGNFPIPCDSSYVAALETVRDAVMDDAREKITGC
jgi:hypothetical protein